MSRTSTESTSAGEEQSWHLLGDAVAAFAGLTGNQSCWPIVVVFQNCPGANRLPLMQLSRRTEAHQPYGFSLFNLDAMATVCQLLSTPADNPLEVCYLGWAWHKQSNEVHVPFVRDKNPGRRRGRDVRRRIPMRHSSLLFAGLALRRPDYIDLWKKLPADSTVEELSATSLFANPVVAN